MKAEKAAATWHGPAATDLRDAIAEAVARALADVARLPKWMQVPALGERLGPVGDLAADAALPVVEAWLAVRPVASGWTEKNIAPQTAAELPLGDGPCQDCGGEFPIWSAHNATWNYVMGGPGRRDDPGGYVCPGCFYRRWQEATAAERDASPTEPTTDKRDDCGCMAPVTVNEAGRIVCDLCGAPR